MLGPGRVGKDDLRRYAKLMAQETAVLEGEIGGLSDTELTELLDRFAEDLSCEQLQRVLSEGTHRLNNGSAGNAALSTAVTNAGKRLELVTGA